MRGIKIKAWDKRNKEIIESSEISKIYFEEEEIAYLEKFDGTLMSKEEFKLMQFTRLRDNNDIEIYEDYIVKTPQGIICRVKYELGSFILINNKFPDSYENINEYYAAEVYCDLEIIGNIYKNPDLLTQVTGKVNK